MRAFAVAAAVAAASIPALAQWTSPADGTMPEDLIPELRPILKTALSQSPAALQANIDLAMADANRYIARSAYWPQVSASGGYNESWAEASGGSGVTNSKGGTYSVGISRDLWEWGADKFRADIGEIQQKIAQRNFAISYRNLATSLREQYMVMIIRRATLKAQKHALDRLEKQFADVKEKVKSGALFANSIGPMQISVDEQTLIYEKLENDFKYMKRSYMHEAGLVDLPDESIPDTMPAPTYNDTLADALLSQFLAGGIDETFESKVLMMQAESAHKSYEIARFNNYPKINASASYGLSFNTNATATSVQISQVKQGAAGINASWDLFDGFQSKYNKLIALQTTRQIQRSKETYTQNQTDLATRNRENCGYLYRSQKIQVLRSDLGLNGVRQLEDQVKRGEVSQDVLENQIILANQSNIAAYQAFADFLSGWTEFIVSVGKDPSIELLDPRYVR